MEATFVKITAVIYLLTAVSYFYFVFRKDTASKLPALALASGLVFHTAALLVRYANEGFAAVALMGEALLFKSWLMVGVYLLIQLKYRLTVLGGIVAPLAFLMCVAALAFGKSGAEIPPGLESFWLPLHVTLAFLGNAVFALAFGVSLIYLLQERHLKHKKMTALLKRFPPLESLDRLNLMLLVWGFPLDDSGHSHRQPVGGNPLGRLLVMGTAARFLRVLPGSFTARFCMAGSPPGCAARRRRS